MKRLLAIIFIFIGISTFAQDMSVSRFYPVPNDLTANTPGTMRRDQNGEVCALIKVETTLDDFIWDVGSLGVREVKRVGGEIWLYVPFGIKKITISHPSFGIIRDYVFNTPIEKARTYVMKLSVKASGAFDSSRKQKVGIKVFPANASLEINGIPIVLDKDGAVSLELPTGVLDIYLAADRYHPLHRSLNLKSSSEPRQLEYRLHQAFGWLNIKGDGDESLRLDGESVKMTPGKNIELPSGHYQLFLKKPYCKAVEQVIEIKDSTVLYFTPTYVEAFRELDFAVPGNAYIWMDGVRLGQGKWHGKVEYGQHRIEAVKEHHGTTVMNLTVDSGTVGPFVLSEPAPLYGSVIIDSSPSSSEIYIDGKYVGKSPYTGKLLEGNHNVRVEKENYITADRVVSIKDGLRSELLVTLEDNIPVTITTNPSSASVFVDDVLLNSSSVRLKTGRHKVKVCAQNYRTVTRDIYVNEPGKNYDFKLNRVFYDRSSFHMQMYGVTDFRNFQMSFGLGGYIKRFNIDFNMILGPFGMNGISDDIDSEVDCCTFSPRIGWGINVGGRLLITPQAGLNVLWLMSSTIDTGTIPFSGLSVTGGLKLSIAIGKVFEFIVVPEYAYCFRRSDEMSELCEYEPKMNSLLEGCRISFGFGLYF